MSHDDDRCEDCGVTYLFHNVSKDACDKFTSWNQMQFLEVDRWVENEIKRTREEELDRLEKKEK